MADHLPVDASAAPPVPSLVDLRWGQPKLQEETLAVYAPFPRAVHVRTVYFAWYKEHKEALNADGFSVWKPYKQPGWWYMVYRVPLADDLFAANARGVERWRVRFTKLCAKWSRVLQPLLDELPVAPATVVDTAAPAAASAASQSQSRTAMPVKRGRGRPRKA